MPKKDTPNPAAAPELADEGKDYNGVPPAERNATICGTIFTCPDFIFAILFIGAVATQLGLCWSYGYDKVNESTASDNTEGRKHVLKLFACALGFATILAQIFIKILSRCGGAMIKCVVFTLVGLLSAMVPVCITYGLPKFAIAFASVVFVVGGYFCCYMGHLQFAGACLEVSCEVVHKNPELQLLALSVVAALMGWSMVFTTAQVGLDVYVQEHDIQYSSRHAMIWVGIIFTYFWGQQVMRNIMVCTTAGTVAEWWWTREDKPTGAAWYQDTLEAFFRACTSQLGTIAFGSFFVALVQTVCYILNKLRYYLDKAGCHFLACLVRCIVCCLRCIQKCAEVFNFYAFVIVGVYGFGFIRAGGHVIALFATRGLLLAEEGMLISIVLYLVVFTVGLTTGAIGAMVALNNPHWTEGYPAPVVSVAVCCTFIGCGVAQVLCATVEAANAAVFLCFVENPKTLEKDHPEAYAKLHDAWVAMGKNERKTDFAGGAPAQAEADDDEPWPPKPTLWALQQANLHAQLDSGN